MMPVDLVLERLKGVKPRGDYYQALCPAHDDYETSLSVAEGEDGRALVKCFAGCDTEDVVAVIGLKMSDLFERRNGYRGGGFYTPPENESTGQPATLENYAAYVSLPVEHLKALSLEQYYRLGKPAVRMPYLDEAGEEVLLVRSRVSLTANPRSLPARETSTASTGSGSSKRPARPGTRCSWRASPMHRRSGFMASPHSEYRDRTAGRWS